MGGVLSNMRHGGFHQGHKQEQSVRDGEAESAVYDQTL